MKKTVITVIMMSMLMVGCAGNPRYVNEGGLIDWQNFNEHTTYEEHIVFADGYDSSGRYSAYSDGSMSANAFMRFSKRRKERMGKMVRGAEK